MSVTIYHNPRCSKSRQTLSLLQEHGVEPEVIKYLDTPPDAATVRDLVGKLGLARAHDVDPMYAAVVPQPRAAHRADPQPLGRFRQRIDDLGRQIVRTRQTDVAGRIDQHRDSIGST